MGRSEPAASLLVEALVVIEPHALHLQQPRGEPRQPPAEHEPACLGVTSPKIGHLQEGLAVGGTFFQRQLFGRVHQHGAADLFAVVAQRLGRENLFQPDEAVAPEGRHLVGRQGVGRVQFGGGGDAIERHGADSAKVG
jgi:hypothetical protein